MKFRRKVREPRPAYEAVQYRRGEWSCEMDRLLGDCARAFYDETDTLSIRTSANEPLIDVEPGEWVLKDEHGTFWTCSAEQFAARYEPVEDQ